jgi:hypothetical protein
MAYEAFLARVTVQGEAVAAFRLFSGFDSGPLPDSCNGNSRKRGYPRRTLKSRGLARLSLMLCASTIGKDPRLDFALTRRNRFVARPCRTICMVSWRDAGERWPIAFAVVIDVGRAATVSVRGQELNG